MAVTKDSGDFLKFNHATEEIFLYLFGDAI